MNVWKYFKDDYFSIKKVIWFIFSDIIFIAAVCSVVLTLPISIIYELRKYFKFHFSAELLAVIMQINLKMHWTILKLLGIYLTVKLSFEITQLNIFEDENLILTFTVLKVLPYSL